MKKKAIISEILKQRRTEEDQYALHTAVGRADAEVGGIPYKIFWLYNNELDSAYGNYDKQRIVHNQPPAYGIAKNSKLGEVIISRKNGSYKTTKGTFSVHFKSLTTYTPSKTPRVDAINGAIEISNKKKFLFRSAYELLHLVEEPVLEKEKLDIDQLLNDQSEAKTLGKELSKLEKEQLETLYNITRYIRDNNELRQQPILDPIQEDIKRSRIYSGPLVIDGGPGTGKTTTLIQRIKFLIDSTITEYWDKAQSLLPELQGNKGWIFFSPSPLLLGFLQNAMAEEGLKASSNRTKVWSNYLNTELLFNYGLVGPDKPFQLYRHSLDSLLNNDPAILSTLMSDLEKFALKQLKQRIEKSRLFKIQDEELKKICLPLIANSASLIDADTISRFIIIADDLSENFGGAIKSRIKQINDQLQANADIVQLRLTRDVDNYPRVLAFLKEQFEKRLAIEEEDDDAIETDETLTIPAATFNEPVELRKNIKRWLRKYLLNKANSEEKIPEKQKKWIEIISQQCKDLPTEELANRVLFAKSIIPLVAGSGPLFFRKIAAVYKAFRRTLPEWFESNGLPGAAGRAKKILEEKEARLHYDERCILILFVNTIIRQLQRQNAIIFRNDGDLFVQAFKDQQRFVIGIDEASDFSLIELACMHSFSHPLYNCTTLSGDLMQRMTREGLSDWETFIKYVGDGEIRSLQTSYRQSPTLLELAKLFYEKVTGKKALYNSYTSISPYEPKPEVKQINNIEDKVIWIAQKIQTIYRTYGNKIPSIAIFVPTNELVLSFAKDLKNCDMLADSGIDVQGVSEEGGLMQKGKVGIFNIQNIKGLEFEAVFFIDIDRIEDSNTELLQKYVYVGLSRAAYYLFITYHSKLPDGLDFLSQYE
jgi:hypothetical protein